MAWEELGKSVVKIDPTQNDIKISGSNLQEKFITTTVVNAESVVAGSNTTDVSMGIDGTESEVWLLVRTDKQPWSLIAEIPTGGYSYGATYPSYHNNANTYGAATPAIAFYLGCVAGTAQGIAVPTTMSEAKALRLPGKSGLRCRVINSHATDTATVTIIVMRIWRN